MSSDLLDEYDKYGILQYVLPTILLLLSFLLTVFAPYASGTYSDVSSVKLVNAVACFGFMTSLLGYATAFFGREGVWGFIDQKIFGFLAFLDLVIFTIASIGLFVIAAVHEEGPMAFLVLGILFVLGDILFFIRARATWRAGHSRVAGILLCLLATVMLITLVKARNFELAKQKAQQARSRGAKATLSSPQIQPEQVAKPEESEDRQRLPTVDAPTVSETVNAAHATRTGPQGNTSTNPAIKEKQHKTESTRKHHRPWGVEIALEAEEE